MNTENDQIHNREITEKVYQPESVLVKKRFLKKIFCRKFFIWMCVSFISPFLLLFLISAIWDYNATIRLEMKFAELKSNGALITLNDLQIKHQYELESLKGPNGAIFYNAAFELIKSKDSEQIKNLPFVGEYKLEEGVSVLDPELLKESEKYLKTLEDFFYLIEKAQNMQGCIFKMNYSDGLSMSLEHHSGIKEITRILQLKACVDFCKGNYEDAFRAIAIGLKLTNSIEKEEMMLSKMLVASIRTSYYTQLANQISMRPNSENNIKSLQKIISENINQQVPQLAILGHTAIIIDVGTNIVSGNFDYIAPLIQEIPYPFAYLKLKLLQGPIKDQFVDQLNSLNEINNYSKLSIREAEKKIKEKSKFLKTERKNFVKQFWSKELMLFSFYPSIYPSIYEIIFLKQMKSKEKLEILEVVLAIELYRIKTGSYPVEFMQIVPEYIKEIPEDYFSDGKLEYQKEENGYYIYSNSTIRNDYRSGALLNGKRIKVDGKTILFSVNKNK